MRCFLLLWCLSCLPTPVFSQPSPTREVDLDAIVQRLVALQTEEVTYDELYESLWHAYAHPLDLNRVTYDELTATYLLSPLQVQSFFDYRTQQGNLLSIYELQAIPYFDLPTIYTLLPFVQVSAEDADSRPFWQRLRTAPTHMLLLRHSRTLEQAKGFLHPDSGQNPPAYNGSPDYIYLRYRLQRPGDFSMGVTLEKDAGEALHWQPAHKTYGADFASYHLMLENRGHWKRVVLGDYQLQIGQGMILSGGFGVGKGAEAVETIRRSHLGIRPYTSALENGYLRGAAATYLLRQWQCTGFYSHTFRDASLDEHTGTVSALQTTGYHRTAHERTSKGRLQEQTLGTDLSYTNATGMFQMGGSFVYTRFDKPIQPPVRRYNQFAFRGKEMWAMALHGHYIWQNIHLFGEAARSENGGMGLVCGLMGSFSAKVSLSMLFRKYDRHFHTLFGQAFGENTRNTNEQGMYWGLKLMPLRKLTCTMYYDTYRFPWLRYRVDAPSTGFDYLLRVAWQPQKNLHLYVQYRKVHQQQNNEIPDVPVHFLVPTLRRQYQMSVQCQTTERLSLQVRIQGSRFNKHGQSNGVVVVQDIQWTCPRWQLTGRMAFFDTDDFENRQYIFEKEVLYGFSMPAYSQQGIRFYFLWKYELTSRFTVWIRVARTRLSNATTIGSGQDEIQEPQRTDIKTQFIYKLK